MNTNVDDLLKEVRVVLDHNNTSTALADIGDVDTLSIDELIESCLVSASRIVETNAPFNLLDRGEPFSGTIYWPEAVGKGSGHIQLPDDFLRLVCFQMSDWSRPVNEVITDESPEYAMQSSRYAGIRGNPQRPVVAIVPWSTGLELEFYSCTGGNDVHVRRARYIKIPSISGEGAARTINICEKLKPAIIYYTAGLVSTSVQSKDYADLLFAQCKELMK